MKKLLSLLFVCIFTIQTLHGEIRSHGGLVWSSQINKFGLYGRHNNLSNHTVSLYLSPTYYYGDDEMPRGKEYVLDDDKSYYPYTGYTPIGFSFYGQIGASFSIVYVYHINHMVGLRIQGSGGYLQGKVGFFRNGVDKNGMPSSSHFQRKFDNVFFRYTAGVEIYPIPSFDLYTYIGGGGITSDINYAINIYDSKIKDVGHTTNTTAILQFGGGYKWTISNFQIGIEFLWNPAIIDNAKSNLDAYPTPTGKYPVDSKTNYFIDGFFEFGINFGYIIQVHGF